MYSRYLTLIFATILSLPSDPNNVPELILGEPAIPISIQQQTIENPPINTEIPSGPSMQLQDALKRLKYAPPELKDI